jgi:glycosyltransferase involved in cell wall biosynthesis
LRPGAILLFKRTIHSYKAAMALQDDQAAADEAAGRQFARLFDLDRDGAFTQFRHLLAQKGQAGRLLQSLGRLGRQDVVLALTDQLTFDSDADDLVVTERARALTALNLAPLAEELFDQIAPSRRADYAFNYNAARILADARLPAKALVYFEAAFRARPTTAAAERIFKVQIALQQYDKAAAAMGRIIRAGSYRDSLAPDFAFLLRHLPVGMLDPELAFSLASLPSNDEEIILPALAPHLIASDLLDSVLATVDRGLPNFASWDADVLTELFSYLERRGQFDHLLRIHERADNLSPSVRDDFALLFARIPAERFPALLMPNVAEYLGNSESSRAYREASDVFSRSADAEAALKMLQLLPALVPGDQAERFYQREKRAMGRLATHAAERLHGRADVLETLTALVVRALDPRVGQFFGGSDAADLASLIANAERMEAAPRGSKAEHLREEYFGFHVERRSFLQLDSISSDFELCDAALKYFPFAADRCGAAATPVGKSLASRLGRNALSLGEGKPLDILTSYVMVRDPPGISLEPSPNFDEFCWWYVTRLCDARKVPPPCLKPEIVGYLNEVVASDNFSGVPITRFLKIAWSEAREDRRKYDLGNFIDRILFVLNRVQLSLPRRIQHLPFYKPFLSNDSGLIRRVLAALNSKVLVGSGIAGKVMRPPAVHIADAPQDIVLIGHAAKETGLGRNFFMLRNGLTEAGFAVKGIDFDASPESADVQLRRWRDGCRTSPIAVFAVNAHDVPDFYLKDRHGILLDSYAAGFFLWEVSTPPPVQKLGIAMVDEIWAPTSYVASIYESLKPTHVIGKGLYRGDELFLNAPRRSATKSVFSFVTVFDFDSSVERKNPLATVLAFQKAFRANEKVELIVKTSNVNPQHWSNAERHWERVVAAALGDPRIKIVTRRFKDEEMTALVRDADCIVSLHRSEGFGYLPADAMAFGTPVIATDYSGSADFCTADTSYPVSCTLVAVPHGAARWRCDGARWAEADIESAAAQMRSVFENRDDAAKKAEGARQSIKSKYATPAFAAALRVRIDAIRAGRH